MHFIKMTLTFGLFLVFAVQAVGQNPPGNQENDEPNSANDQAVVTKNAKPDAEQEEVTLSEETKSDIVKLITINNELKTRLLYLLNSYEQLKIRTPGVKKEFWDKCREMFHKDKLADKLAPVYAKHYTPEEIKELVKFFETPVGKKFVEKSMLVGREMNVVTNQFGTDVGEKIKSKLDQEGYSR